MRSSQSRPNSESGFTLIELLVVMLILGILAAIALPAFTKHDSTKVVEAEVCGLPASHVQLPEEAGGTYAFKGEKILTLHGSYRFTLDTDEQTITSVEPLGAEEKVLRC